ncbi:hypothetical protein ACK1TF_000180 [Salmonella enterica]
MGMQFAFAFWLWPLGIADILLLLLTFSAWRSPRGRAVLLWVILPQIAIVAIGAPILQWLEVNDMSSSIILALICQFFPLFIAVCGRRYLRYLWPLCHFLFIAVWRYIVFSH